MKQEPPGKRAATSLEKKVPCTSKSEIFSTDRDRLEKEVVIQTFRGSGPGGQHRNVTDSGVRIIHEISGLSVTATESRSQLRNKEKAFERLIGRLERLNQVEKTRIPTKKRRGTREKELQVKHQIQGKKRLRQKPNLED